VLFAVPGAFTPGCSVRHLPGYITALEEIKGKKVDVVAVLAFNDAFVMSAWGKANGIKDELVSGFSVLFRRLSGRGKAVKRRTICTLQKIVIQGHSRKSFGGPCSIANAKGQPHSLFTAPFLPAQALTDLPDAQLFLSDPETKFSKSIGWNLGERTARYAMIIDHGKVVYAEKEPGREVTVSAMRARFLASCMSFKLSLARGMASGPMMDREASLPVVVAACPIVDCACALPARAG
jgi:peroxiredoxin